MSDEQKHVLIRLPNEDDGTYIVFDAFLITENLAYAIFDEQLEIHMIVPTDTLGLYDLRYATNPMFYVGGDVCEIFEDLQKMNLLEFAVKYVHSDFNFPQIRLA